MTVTMDRLQRRLDRVEALHRGATTAGERTAAARARDRIAARIDQLRSDDPVALFVRAHLQSLMVAPTTPPEPPAALPTEEQILALLALWESGEWHWRDVHAPLALRHHPGLWHYHQVSVDAVLDGPELDGFALCAFASEQERKERFFGGPDDRAIIEKDVACFADLAHSPRPVRMVEWRFGADEERRHDGEADRWS